MVQFDEMIPGIQFDRCALVSGKHQMQLPQNVITCEYKYIYYYILLLINCLITCTVVEKCFILFYTFFL